MNLPPQPPVTGHPLVARYLDELERLLHDVDPVERTEVLDGVREHLEASLHGTAAGDAEVQAALDAIGPPQAVADEAYAGRPVGTVPPPTPVTAQPPRVPATSRSWVPPVVAVLSGLSLLQLVVAMLVDIDPVPSTGPSRTITSDNAVIEAGPDLQPGADEVAMSALSLVGALPFWLPLVVLVAASALWRPREKTLLILLTPIAVVAVIFLPVLTQDLTGTGGAVAGFRFALGAIVLGGIAAITVLVRRAGRRVAPPVSPSRPWTERRPPSSRAWLPASVALLQALALLLVVTITTSANTVSSTESVRFGPNGQVLRTVGETVFDGQPGTGLVGLFVAFPCWLPLVLLVTATTLWTRRERWLLVVVVPVGAFLLGTLPAIGWLAFGENGVVVAVRIGMVVGLVGGATLTAVLVRRALVRAATLRASETRGAPWAGRRARSSPSPRATTQEPR